MAYPTVAGPYGLVPVKNLSGVPYVGSVYRHYGIANAYNTAIFRGDAVRIVAGGTIERDAADNAMTPIGVFMGCSYTDPGQNQKIFKQYYPASTAAADIVAYVADDPNLLFKVAIVSGTTVIGSMATTDIGANGELVDNTGSTITGNSKVGLLETSAATGTFPVRIVELVPETVNSAGNFTEALVKWNAGHQFGATTGV
jgi:hypothetical protein